MPQNATPYFAHTMPGIERIAWQEIQERLAGASLQGYKTIPRKNGIVLFDFAGSESNLSRLATVEDVFAVLVRIPRVPWGREGLTQIFQTISRDRRIGRRLQHLSPDNKRLRPLRVITRMVGGRQPYRRMDLNRAVEGAFKRIYRQRDGRRRPSREIEVWANLIGHDFICGLRLSDAQMRHRDYKTAHTEASLRPSAAAAMVWLTRPRDDDVFLDPMCGAGTLLIERANMARHCLLVGADLDPVSLLAAKENLGPRHKPRDLIQWDAGALALENASVNAIASNLPFGVRIGSHRANVPLYQAFFAEAARVLVPGGKLVVLSSETELVRRAAGEVGALAMQRDYDITILGRSARIHVLRRIHHI